MVLGEVWYVLLGIDLNWLRIRLVWKLCEYLDESSCSELLNVCALSIVRFSKNYVTQRFENSICTRSQIRDQSLR
jgi:hypothetical protein